MASRGIELTQSKQELLQERDMKRALSQRVDELLAYIERINQQHQALLQPDTAAVNFEYLKNCIFRYMSTSELSEQKR